MKKIVLFLCIALASQVVMAGGNDEAKENQEVAKSSVVKGALYEIVDGEKIALPFANVYIEGTTEVTNSDFDGSFELTTNNNRCVVKCTFKGYESFEKEISVEKNEDVSLEIFLIRNTTPDTSSALASAIK